MPEQNRLRESVRSFMEKAAAEGLLRSLRSVERVSARECVVEGRRCLDFSSNDYLGLSFHPALKAEAVRWTERYGCGSSASRLISGTSEAVLQLEERIAAWKGFEAAMILGSGYAANVGVLQALLSRDSAVFADKLNHASLNAGCVLSQADFKRYRHNDVSSLERMLSAADAASAKLVVSDSVFSMDGDIAPLDEIKRVADAAGAFVMLDDAHASGVLGERGHGLAAPANCDLAISTFSKALGSYGACAACSKEMKEYLVNKCGPFIYSTALPPPALGAISTAIDFVQTSECEAMRSALAENAKLLRAELGRRGFDCGASETMIVPLIVGETGKCLALSKALLERGIFAPSVRPPTVPKGSARLRLSLNAAHTQSDIERLAGAIGSLIKTLA